MVMPHPPEAMDGDGIPSLRFRERSARGPEHEVGFSNGVTGDMTHAGLPQPIGDGDHMADTCEGVIYTVIRQIDRRTCREAVGGREYRRMGGETGPCDPDGLFLLRDCAPLALVHVAEFADRIGEMRAALPGSNTSLSKPRVGRSHHG